MGKFEIDIAVNKRAVVIGLLVIGVIALAFVAGTAETHRFWRIWAGDWAAAPRVQHYLIQANLAQENVVAAWFSSTLLLLVALAAALCFALDRKGPAHSLFSYGWLIVAAAFAALSLDELGSLHERLFMRFHGYGWLLWLGPFVLAALIFMIPFGWQQMRRSLVASGFAILGVVCFGTIPFQEYVEIDVMYRSAGAGWQRPIPYILLEEGTELLGMLSFLIALCIYAGKLAAGVKTRRGMPGIVIEMDSRIASGVILLLAGACFAAMLLSGLVIQPHEESGNPANWFPSAVAFVAFLLCLLHARRSSGRVAPMAYRAAAIACLLMSAYIGGEMHVLAAEYRNLRILIFGIVVVAGVALTLTSNNWPHRASIGAWALLSGLVMSISQSDMAAFLLLAAATMMLITLVARLDARVQMRMGLAKAS